MRLADELEAFATMTGHVLFDTDLATIRRAVEALRAADAIIDAWFEMDRLDVAWSEMIEQSIGEGWDNDPTGSSHIASARDRANRAKAKALGMRAAFLINRSLDKRPSAAERSEDERV